MRTIIAILVALVLWSDVCCAGTVRPNPKANARCAFGPGAVSARWPIKTSVPGNESPSSARDVAIDDLINAPDIQPTTQSVTVASRLLHQAMQLSQSSAANAAPFVLQYRWGSGTRFMETGPRTVRLRPITPSIVAAASAVARDTAAETGQHPPMFFALLAVEFDNRRIPGAIALGGADFQEGDFVTTSGYVLASVCEQDDGDFHIDLAPSAHASTCAVVEVPNPYFIGQRNLAQSVDASEAFAKSLSQGQHITVTGQLFYDAQHGSDGGGRGIGHCARSLWEIHPVFRVQDAYSSR